MNSELSRALSLIQDLLAQCDRYEMQVLLRDSGLEEHLFYEALGWLVTERKLTVNGKLVRWNPTRITHPLDSEVSASYAQGRIVPGRL